MLIALIFRIIVLYRSAFPSNFSFQKKKCQWLVQQTNSFLKKSNIDISGWSVEQMNALWQKIVDIKERAVEQIDVLMKKCVEQKD